MMSERRLNVGRVLPHWLLHPIAVKQNINENLKSPISSCPTLEKKLVDKLKKNGIQYLFPVQQAVIPQVLSGSHLIEHRFPPRDICVATPTGSGKTLAFVLPIVQALRNYSIPAIRALILLPVVELAQQVYNVFCEYGSCYNLKVGHAFGIGNFASEQKNLITTFCDKSYSAVDILVATPGRLIDHIINTPLNFSQLRFFVLDEADKMLIIDGGEKVFRIQQFLKKFKSPIVTLGLPPFFPVTSEETRMKPAGNDVTLSRKEQNELFHRPFEEDKEMDVEEEESLFPMVSPPIQKLLFSATLSHNPEQLQNVGLFRPILFAVELSSSNQQTCRELVVRPSKPSGLTEQYVISELSLKPLVLHHLLNEELEKNDKLKVLVFVNSIELSAKLSLLLRTMAKQKYCVEDFSSTFNKKRKEKIRRFLRGKINVLVSTDAVARGVDVPDIDCVVSYDLPSANTYVHRVGRTARAGKPGKAVSIVTQKDLSSLKKVVGADEFAAFGECFVNEADLIRFESQFRSALENLSEATKTRTKHRSKVFNRLKKKSLAKKKN